MFFQAASRNSNLERDLTLACLSVPMVSCSFRFGRKEGQPCQAQGIQNAVAKFEGVRSSCKGGTKVAVKTSLRFDFLVSLRRALDFSVRWDRG